MKERFERIVFFDLFQIVGIKHMFFLFDLVYELAVIRILKDKVLNMFDYMKAVSQPLAHSCHGILDIIHIKH